MKIQKFKHNGKVVKVTPCGTLKYKNVKTGEIYDLEELELIPPRQLASWGFHIGKFGVYVYARHYFDFKGFCLGVGLDIINGRDSAIDFELKAIFGGVGIRFIYLKSWNEK